MVMVTIGMVVIGMVMVVVVVPMLVPMLVRIAMLTATRRIIPYRVAKLSVATSIRQHYML